MTVQVYRTTAEHVVAATDAALQRPTGVTKKTLAAFLDIPEDSAAAALSMAAQLGFLAKSGTQKFKVVFPYASYLITSDRQEKAAVLRFVLEQYAPYKTYRLRLGLEGLAPPAASQTRAIHSITAHRDVIMATFNDLGMYANSLVSEGAGLFRPREEEAVSFMVTVSDVIQAREDAEIVVRRRLGQETADWVDNDDVLSSLVTAHQQLARANEDAKAPVLHAGNAVESFLAQLATSKVVNITGANGINAKAERLKTANAINKKHLNMLKYLGHVRNAADHGVDPDIGAAWDICENTAIEYVHVAQTVIKACFNFDNGTYVL